MLNVLRWPWTRCLKWCRCLINAFLMPAWQPSVSKLHNKTINGPAVPETVDPMPVVEWPVRVACANPEQNPSPVNPAMAWGDSSDLLKIYLEQRGNRAEEIARLDSIQHMPSLILEIGCGAGEVAQEIAINNPDIGVIATDLYDWSSPLKRCSHYRQTALAWRERRLTVQLTRLSNLVVLRADAEILRYLPLKRIDSLVLINPEPKVGKAFLAFLHETGLDRHIKPGPRRLVVVPYSREIGVMSCGGLEFDHPADWSRGLGFLFESGFDFLKDDRIHWGVDLPGTSPYTTNSSQTDVYCAGRRLKL